MGKRQTRIFNRDLEARQAEFLNREVQAVLQNGMVMQGKATALEAGKITVTDKRFHKHTVAITEVAEVVFDQESLY